MNMYKLLVLTNPLTYVVMAPFIAGAFISTITNKKIYHFKDLLVKIDESMFKEFN